MPKFTVKAAATAPVVLTFRDIEAVSEEDAMQFIERNQPRATSVEIENAFKIDSFEIVPPEPEAEQGLTLFNIVAHEMHRVETTYTVQATNEEAAKEMVQNGDVGYETIEIYGSGDDREFLAIESITPLD